MPRAQLWGSLFVNILCPLAFDVSCFLIHAWLCKMGMEIASVLFSINTNQACEVCSDAGMMPGSSSGDPILIIVDQDNLLQIRSSDSMCINKERSNPASLARSPEFEAALRTCAGHVCSVSLLVILYIMLLISSLCSLWSWSNISTWATGCAFSTVTFFVQTLRLFAFWEQVQFSSQKINKNLSAEGVWCAIHLFVFCRKWSQLCCTFIKSCLSTSLQNEM